MSSSFSSSNLREKRWVDQISKHFSLDIDPKPCVFRVPNHLFHQKPDDYVPQNLCLGPYQHHFMSDLYDAQKIAALKKHLSEDQFIGFKALVVDKLKQIEPAIRASYDQFLDLEGETLMWILAIDGTYLLHLLSSYLDKEIVSPEDKDFARDIVILENQIPSLVLKDIKKSLGSSDKVFLEFSAFSHMYSPFPIEKNIDIPGKHLLDYMYNLTCQFVHKQKVAEKTKNPENKAPVAVSLLSSAETTTINAPSPNTEAAIKALEALADLLRGARAERPFMFLASLPWQMCLGLFDAIEKPASFDEIQVPSVTQLHKVAKIKFEVTHGGIGCSKFDEDKRTLYLPKITLNTDSEVILRNLVAYEEAKATADSKSEIADYVDFMCGIIDSAEDAEFLKERLIIESDLENEEIAKIFNGIIKSSRMRGYLEEITQKLNEFYGTTHEIKIWRFIKEHIIPSKASMKVLGLILQILVVILLSVAAYCDVFGCSGSILRHLYILYRVNFNKLPVL